MKLMLIEDEKKEQDKFKKLAEKMNDVTFVKITNSTEEGIKCLKENDIDGVILDLELNSGIGNGFEFLEKLKITKLSKIPKIVVTTNVYSDSVYDYLHQNKVDFIFYKKQENYNVENVINTLLLLNNYTNTASTDIKEIEESLDDMDLNLLYVNEDKVISILDYLVSIGFTNIKELLMYKSNLFYIKLDVIIDRISKDKENIIKEINEDVSYLDKVGL